MKPPRAAIYARRSTDEHQVESLDTQLDKARRFVIAKNFTIDPRHEFIDTASRAEFAPKRRPGFAALRDAAINGSFDVIIRRDDSRLGGDMLRVATFAQEVTDAGVHIVFYSTGEEMVLDNETSRLLAVMRGFASESERRKISSRTREGAERKLVEGSLLAELSVDIATLPRPKEREKSARSTKRKQRSCAKSSSVTPTGSDFARSANPFQNARFRHLAQANEASVRGCRVRYMRCSGDLSTSVASSGDTFTKPTKIRHSDAHERPSA